MAGREVQVGAADLCLVTFSPSSDVVLSGSCKAAATVQTCTPASGMQINWPGAALSFAA